MNCPIVPRSTQLTECGNKDLYRAVREELERTNHTELERDFADFFERTSENVYQLYQKAKNKYWNRKALILEIIGAAVLCIALALGSAMIAALSSGNLPQICVKWTLTSAVLGLLVFLILLLILLFYELRRKRNYRETWVRHSLLYHRLILCAEKFIYSEMNASEFKVQIFQLLDEDLSAFQMNMNGKQTSCSTTEKESRK